MMSLSLKVWGNDYWVGSRLLAQPTGGSKHTDNREYQNNNHGDSI